jgi:hypothetical protein
MLVRWPAARNFELKDFQFYQDNDMEESFSSRFLEAGVSAPLCHENLLFKPTLP